MDEINKENVLNTTFFKVQDWLLSIDFESTIRAHRDLKSVLHSLLGLWICKVALGRVNHPQRYEKYLDFAETVLGNEKIESFYAAQYDSKLLLICGYILRVHNRPAPLLDRFMEQVGDALKTLEVVPMQYAAEAIFLHHIGVSEPTAAPFIQEDKIDIEPLRLLRAPPEELRSLYTIIGSLTLFGKKPYSEARIEKALAETLSMIFLEVLRDYDLELAAIILRTIGYLSSARNQVSKALNQGISYLLTQQRPDGKFGFYVLHNCFGNKADVSTHFNVDLKFYLPITVSCLWSLAEVLLPDFNIFYPPLNNKIVDSPRDGVQYRKKKSNKMSQP